MFFIFIYVCVIGVNLSDQKTRLNEDNVSNAIWRERPSEAWPNVHDFIGFVNGDFHNKKLAKHIDAASASATPNPDEVDFIYPSSSICLFHFIIYMVAI